MRNTLLISFCSMLYIIFMMLVIFITIYPFWHELAASFSDSNLPLRHTGALFLPEGFSLSAYEHVLQDQRIFTGYLNTLFVVIVGMALNVRMTLLEA